MRALRFLLILSAFCLGASPGWSTEIRQVEGGPIHEAFIAPITGAVALDAVPNEPPQPITEHIPGHPEEHQEWVPGYWAWSQTEDDFIWVSGVWRCTPPGKIWIPGFWKQFDEGWVWIRGFWSAQPDTQLEYIAQSPPDPLEEEVGNPPSPDHFWAPGYWFYNDTTEAYEWLEGEWETFDPNWVFVPAYYVWRPEGWVLVPPYWDWPMNSCGRAYACIWIPLELRHDYIYEPIWILEPVIIIKSCYAVYPSYVCWCHHHWHYNPTFWSSCGCAPTWWHWNDWWCMSWHNHWAVWWWWCNPGYPHPTWLNKHAADMIAPPKNMVLKWVKHATPPAIVLPNGVVSSHDLMKALNQIVKGKGGKNSIPVLPANKNAIQQIQNKALTKTIVPHNILKPTGKPGDWQNAPDLIKKLPLQIPGIDKDKEKGKGPRIQLPSKDLLPKVVPKAIDLLKNIKIDKEDYDLPKRPAGGHIRPIRPDRHIKLPEDKPDIQIIDRPAIHKIDTDTSSDKEPIHQIDLQRQHRERLEKLQRYQQQKQEQQQQRHQQKLDKIRLQHSQDQQDLENKNDQRLQWLKQQQDKDLQQKQLKHEEKQRELQLRHEQRADFERQQQQLEQRHQMQYLKQMQQQQEQQQQQQRFQQDQQQQIDQLHQYRHQQEQQQQDRIKRIQQFRQPQAFQQTPYKPEVHKISTNNG